jgi:hypothetical protein
LTTERVRALRRATSPEDHEKGAAMRRVGNVTGGFMMVSVISALSLVSLVSWATASEGQAKPVKKLG